MAVSESQYYFATGYEKDPALLGAIVGQDEAYVRLCGLEAVALNATLRLVNFSQVPNKYTWRGDGIKSAILHKWVDHYHYEEDEAGNRVQIEEPDFIDDRPVTIDEKKFNLTTIVPKIGGITRGRLLPITGDEENIIANWRLSKYVTEKIMLPVVPENEPISSVVEASTFDLSPRWLTKRLTEWDGVTRQLSFTASLKMIGRAEQTRLAYLAEQTTPEWQGLRVLPSFEDD